MTRYPGHVKQVIINQAKCSEILRHYAWAAILWRRVGRIEDADKCEVIVSAMAKNPRIKLAVENPVDVIK